MRRNPNYQTPSLNLGAAGAFITATVLVIAVLVFGAASFVNIQPGYVGVLFDAQAHEVTPGFLRPGFGFKIPLVQFVQQYPVGTQVLTMIAKTTEGRVQGDDSIKAQSIEGQDIFIDTTIKYHVIAEKAGLLYTKWQGADIHYVEDNAVRRAARSVIPIIAGKMGVIGIYGNERDVLEKNAFALLREELSKDFLELEAVQIGEVHISDALKQSLEQKVAAQQAAEQAKFALDKAETEAKTAAAVARAAEAKGESDYAFILSKGQADARRIQADAEAYYNTAVARSLTPDLVQLKAIEKLADKISVVLAPVGTTPLLGLDSLLKK
jgi:regulator of protease activity HflC (stomatin/prohibitin superfamily)